MDVLFLPAFLFKNIAFSTFRFIEYLKVIVNLCYFQSKNILFLKNKYINQINHNITVTIIKYCWHIASRNQVLTIRQFVFSFT